MHPNILKVLSGQNITYREVRHDAFDMPINSPFDFAAALNYVPERITKSVFLSSKAKDKYVMAVCPAGKKLDFKKLAQLAGVNKLEVADRQDLAVITDYPITGVCSIGLPHDIEVYIDKGIFEFDTVLVGSGEVAVEIEITPGDLLKASNGNSDTITL